MREAGRVVARGLHAVREAAAPGVRPRELDEVAREVLREAGADSPFLDYHPHFAPVRSPRRSSSRSTTRSCTASRATSRYATATS
ncbi:hypothetical protein GA0115246_107425 [Streptomyces sp. SolWspMP-sol7th]|nr:hypothetical protein GA0115246_107425 [Streptomyces sp. SolWspMP-sol7th]